jgi:hypothetical protein
MCCRLSRKSDYQGAGARFYKQELRQRRRGRSTLERAGDRSNVGNSYLT